MSAGPTTRSRTSQLGFLRGNDLRWQRIGGERRSRLWLSSTTTDSPKAPCHAEKQTEKQKHHQGPSQQDGHAPSPSVSGHGHFGNQKTDRTTCCSAQQRSQRKSWQKHFRLSYSERLGKDPSPDNRLGSSSEKIYQPVRFREELVPNSARNPMECAPVARSLRRSAKEFPSRPLRKRAVSLSCRHREPCVYPPLVNRSSWRDLGVFLSATFGGRWNRSRGRFANLPTPSVTNGVEARESVRERRDRACGVYFLLYS